MLNVRVLFLAFIILFYLLNEVVSLPMLNVKVVDRAILVQWNFTGHVTGTIRKYRVSYNLLPDPNVIDIVVDAKTNFAIIDCGGRYHIQPRTTLEITSPHYPGSYEPGVFCKWSVFTNSSYALGYYVKEVDFGNLFPVCENSYLTIATSSVRKHLCHSHVTMETRMSSFDVVFQSGNKIKGSGFKMILKSEVKSAGPPSNVVMHMSKGGILLSWSAPEGEYLPITSYFLDYTSLPGGMTHKIMLSPRMNRYIIRVSGHEGQMFVINIKANIGDKMGVAKRLFFRPPCFHLVDLSNSKTTNITSPLYPYNYPRGISCVWRIETRVGETIQLKILFMDIEDDVFCSGDYLQISEHTERFCGRSTQEKVFTSAGNSVDLKFLSDGSKTGKGFVVQAQAVGKMTSPSTGITTKTSTTLSSSPKTPSSTSVSIKITTPLPPVLQISSTKSISASTEQTVTNSVYISNSTTSLEATSVALPYNTHSSHITDESLHGDTTHYKSLNRTLMANTTYVVDTSTVPSASSSSKISTISAWAGLGTSTYFSTPKNVEGTTERESPKNFSNEVYFEPDINGRMHSVFFNLKLKRRISNEILMINNTYDLKEQLRTKFIYAFQDRNMFCSLEVDDIIVSRDFKTAEVYFSVNYNLSVLLSRYMQNTSFRLIQHINQTNLGYLSRDNVISDDWIIDMNSLSQFRENEIAKQEIHTSCEMMTTICCSNYTCVRMNESALGLVCCKSSVTKVFPQCNVSTSNICVNTQNFKSTPSSPTIKIDERADNSSTISIVVTVTIVSVVMAIITGIVMFYARKKKIFCSKVDVKLQDRQGCIEMHDILQSKFVGGKNIELTGFKIYKKHKNKRNIGGSLPSRNNNKNQLDKDIEEKLKQLGLFIEDTETLKKRLRLKCSLRRGNSL